MFKHSLLSLLIVLCVALQGRADELNVVVLADVHLMAPELIVKDGSALNKYVLKDRKLLRESAALLSELTKEVIAKNPDYVFIAGDLTKDGEKVSHQYLIENALSKFAAAGIKCVVAPGNHDINNPHAVEFDGAESRRVESVSPEEFSKMYEQYGYGDAIARDKESLTYVYQISPKLRVLSIDACKYYLNNFSTDECRHDGVVRLSTMTFIKEQLDKANEDNVEVIGLMHHNLLPHWSCQDDLMKGFIIDDYKNLSKTLADRGVKVVFTGHSHAHDIAMQDGIYDVQTGSAVTFPSPYRFVTITEDMVDIKSDRIKGIEYDMQGLSFDEYSRKYTSEGLSNIVAMLFSDLPSDLSKRAGDSFAFSMTSHYQGDEQFSDEYRAEINDISREIGKYSRKWSRMFRKMSYSLLEDGEPSDKELVIKFDK